MELLVSLIAAILAGVAISSTAALLVPSPNPANLVATIRPASELSPTLIPTMGVRTNLPNIVASRTPDDKLAGITCGTTRHPYEGQAKVKRINRGYEYLWKRGSYWTVYPNRADRVSCSWDSGIFIINETPNQITIAMARVADLARNIRIKCDDKSNHVNGEVTDSGGSVIVVSQSDC